MGSSAPRLGNPLPITFPSHFPKNIAKETPLDIGHALALLPGAGERKRARKRKGDNDGQVESEVAGTSVGASARASEHERGSPSARAPGGQSWPGRERARWHSRVRKSEGGGDEADAGRAERKRKRMHPSRRADPQAH